MNLTFAEKVDAMPDDMTDVEVDRQITRADRFIAGLREMIDDAIANSVSRIEQHGQCLRRIAATIDQVDYVTMCNLANLDAAWRARMGGMSVPVSDRGLRDGGWLRPDAGPCRRGGVPRGVRAHDRRSRTSGGCNGAAITDLEAGAAHAAASAGGVRDQAKAAQKQDPCRASGTRCGHDSRPGQPMVVDQDGACLARSKPWLSDFGSRRRTVTVAMSMGR
jgi:hypothetical protein